MDKRLPAPPLTAAEAERVLAQPDVGELLILAQTVARSYETLIKQRKLG